MSTRNGVWTHEPDDPEPTPVAGMDATLHVGSDDYPYVVIEVNRNGKELKLAEVEQRFTPDDDEFDAEIDLAPPKTVEATLRDDGKYRQKGTQIWVELGRAHSHRDRMF